MFSSALPSLHPLQESQEVRRVRVRPATTKRQGVFLTVAHINNKHTHLSHTPQNNSLCVLFHQEVRPDHQTLGLPAEQRKKSCTPFSYGNTLLKKNSIMKCGAAKCVMNVADEVPWVQTVPACPWRRQIQDDPVKITTVT